MKIQIAHESGTYYVPYTSARLARLLKLSFFIGPGWWIYEIVSGGITLSTASDMAIWILVWTALLLADLSRCYWFSISNIRVSALPILAWSLLSFCFSGGGLWFLITNNDVNDPLAARGVEKVCSGIFAALSLVEAMEGTIILAKVTRDRFR